MLRLILQAGSQKNPAYHGAVRHRTALNNYVRAARSDYHLAGPAQTGSKVPKSGLSGPDPSES